MGFKLPTNSVTFELAGYEGAEITASLQADIAAFYAVQGISSAAEVGEVGLEQIREIVGFFAEHIATGWNFEEEDGTPIPLTAERMLKLPVGILIAIITGWQAAAVGLGAPLGEESANGGTSPEESAGTEAE